MRPRGKNYISSFISSFTSNYISRRIVTKRDFGVKQSGRTGKNCLYNFFSSTARVAYWTYLHDMKNGYVYIVRLHLCEVDLPCVLEININSRNKRAYGILLFMRLYHANVNVDLMIEKKM